MHILKTCKSKKVWINSNQEKVNTSIFHTLKSSSVEGGRIWLKFKLIQALMHILITCKNQT